MAAEGTMRERSRDRGGDAFDCCIEPRPYRSIFRELVRDAFGIAILRQFSGGFAPFNIVPLLSRYGIEECGAGASPLAIESTSASIAVSSHAAPISGMPRRRP